MRFTVTRLLAADLWSPDGPEVRSLELSPLYIEHFRGPHAGRVLTDHAHWELLHVLDGHGRLRSHGEPQVLQPDDLLLIPPEFPHAEESAQDLDILWIGLQGSLVESVSPDCIRRTSNPGLREWSQRLIERNNRPFDRIGPELDAICRILLSRLFQSLQTTVPNPDTDRIDAAIDFLSAHFQSVLPIPELARQFGYSEGHFFRLFRRRTGRTPVQYLLELRLRHACRWLEQTDLSIERIAEMVGFDDPRYFARVFKRSLRQTPSGFRARQLPP